MGKLTIPAFLGRKQAGPRLTMVTAYDFPSALLAQEAGVDAILVGDSLGMTVLGYPSTVPVTLEEMLHHLRAVVRGAQETLIVCDLPFGSYQAGEEEALKGAIACLKAGADAVKLEGGEAFAPLVRRLVRAGVPVMGHVGLTPQTAGMLGGYRVQGRTAAAARQVLADALALAAAGAFAVVLECVPAALAAWVTARLSVPTIGIGAGPHCDGQVLVWHDLLGLFHRPSPRFARRFADLSGPIRAALGEFVRAVQQGEFPGPEHSFAMEAGELERALGGNVSLALSGYLEGQGRGPVGLDSSLGLQQHGDGVNFR